MEVFYHGSPKKFDSFEQKPWVAFDRKTVLSPLWFTKDKSFAKQNAGPNGWIYTVQVTPKKTFPTQDLIMWDGSYQMPTPYGEKLVEAMIARRMFGLDIDDWFEAEEVLKSIERLDYDVLETGDFISWLKDNNYDSFLVRGDGPTNLAVLDGEDVEILSREPASMSESNLENLLGELLNEEISPEAEKKIKTADPNDVLTVYHGTPRFRIPDLINGFDSTNVHSRDYGGQKHRGLFVTPDFEVAKSFGGGAVFEIKIRAKYLHGTDYSGNIGRELKKRDEGLEDWVKGKFPNSFRPYMAMTMLQNVEPQALLIGVVKPSQITRVWVREKDDWVEYTRDELAKSELSYNTRRVLDRYEHETVADAGISLSDPRLKLEDFLGALAKYEKGDVERYMKMFKFYAKMSVDKLKDRLSQIEIGGSRLGRLALNNVVKQVVEQLDEATAPLESLLEYLLIEGRTKTDETLQRVLQDWAEHDKRAPKGPHWFPPRELFRYREFLRPTRPDLQKSMRQKGFDPKYPIQLAFGKNGKILIVEGNHRLKTAIQLKIDKVPVEFNFMNKVEKWQEMEDKANMTLDKEKIRKQQAEKRKKAEDRKLGIDSMEKLLQQQREKRKAELKAMSPEEREEHEKKKEKNVEDIMKLIGF